MKKVIRSKKLEVRIKNLLNEKGVTLTELLVVIAIFSIVIAGVYAVYVTQVKHTMREHRVAESEMELDIIKNFMERDIAMGGYGLADDYSGLAFNPVPISATDGNPDTLTLMGTALGTASRGSQGWSYIRDETPTFGPPPTGQWEDARENLQAGDRVIYMEPNTKTLFESGGTWLFIYDLPSPITPTTDIGTIVYGLHGSENTNFPYYAVEYSLGGTPAGICAPPATGVNAVVSLERAESKDTIPPPPGARRPILDCVRDFQVAFGLDTDEDGDIECWDNGGAVAATYDNRDLKKRLKQIKVYMLVQIGRRNPDREVYTAGQTFRVGDTALTECDEAGGVGRDVTLTSEQRWYRWRVVSLSITPRNLR